MTRVVGTRATGTVLLVDDAEADNFLHRRALEGADIAAEIVTRVDAQGGLDYLENQADGRRPALLLLDINMPGMNGWEFLAAYQQLPRTQRADALVMLTTSTNPADRERAESLDVVDAYLTKPLTTADVATLVDELFPG